MTSKERIRVGKKKIASGKTLIRRIVIEIETGGIRKEIGSMNKETNTRTMICTFL